MKSIKSIFNKEQNLNIPNIPNISIDKNLIFIHIPKNAGTSIYNSLGLKDSKHRTAKEYIKILGQEKYDSMFSLAFVRNPFSRFISLYNYARMEVSYYHNNISPDKAIYGNHMDYELLKTKSIEEAAILLKEGKLIHNPPHIQWNPQNFWLKDENDKINVKYLGRLEDLEFNMRNISQITGLKNSSIVKRINASSENKLDYKKLITNSTREILEDVYKEDLEIFNYQF
ncbi:sulfotransferase [Formosa agariphila KMM 3901]|uniref:Sulfotransferase n=1 Tax=Formosa agariphila (strain DSM 15362 / KCTC 12365 / LMG 23005 / KMM 3901 / M-2Alg 35-1) TaxID=1347342 RepID=T2KQA8_FORAG|nr:sulfotransferase family 2 domain-containing protein [Formosa agariphila]CDF80641.1 sulfotransferase [Formosa agariphila KMM 3901]